MDILLNGIVSLTLTPMLCSRFLKGGKKHGSLYKSIDRGFHAMDRAYISLLSASMNNHRLAE